MENIHVLPTDKPSNIVISTIDGKLKLNNNINDTVEYPGKNQHIYITSDEEMKEGDWVKNITIELEHPFKLDADGILYTTLSPGKFKKIILTTDQDLINDSVQPIDDEFLNWFVQNPSCEFVEVEYGDDGNGHQIIIPKEEAKQETLEEAAERLLNLNELDKFRDFHYIQELKNTFKLGAKWQQQTMPIHILDVENIYVHIDNGIIICETNDKTIKRYSEKEVKDLIYKVRGTVARLQGTTLNDNHIDTAYKLF
jgi:hypothetical protein